MAQNLWCGSACSGNDYRAVVLRTFPVNGSDFIYDVLKLIRPHLANADTTQWCNRFQLNDQHYHHHYHHQRQPPSAIWTKCRSHSFQHSGWIVFGQCVAVTHLLSRNEFEFWRVADIFLSYSMIIVISLFFHTKMSCRHHSREPDPFR